MLKIIFIISIFIISTYIGFAYGETFRRRQDELKEILKGLIILENEIVYGTTPLPEAFEKISNKLCEPSSIFIKAITNRLVKGDVESVYEGAIEEFALLENKFYLYDEDKKVMVDFFKSLGESGVYGQEKIFSLAIEGIKMNLREADEIAKKNIKLYRYLGICLGAMIIIFII
ncbi:stage III sporulation protein SpoAB [Clostridium puniceum]|uniref:Stage III sporulation protein SpoAB n=1 Tax=Clostridium puniceum TaxID=29367 RepID=A0A1S8TTM1_9CLOT|nr:stage III sporulation protein SpoIIIAB [Clostridium puniceum]OOM80999.1 stage III sporulation protein SpoAB [Clostridium puniceum]